MRKHLGTSLVTVLLLMTCVELGFGQERSTGSIVGAVTDQSGAAIPEVTITVTNVATGAVRTTATGASGNYTLPILPAGRYQIAASKQGFERFILENVPLQVAQTLTEDISMKLGQLTQEVTVTAQLVAVDTKTATLGQVVGSQESTELPLNGRSFIQLAMLAPGAIMPGNGQGEDTPSGFGHSNVAVSIGGQRSYTSDVTFDGIPSKDMEYGPVGFQLDVDSIAEFKVQDGFTPPTDAVSGKINVVTKSGTNSFHGSAWEFVRNEKFDARNFFATTKNPFRQNQFGASSGGPIIKNKLFFFADYEGVRIRKGNPAVGVVATPAMLQGNFSSLTKTIVDPSTGQPFAENVIPTARISNFANKFTQYLPAQNQTGATNRYVNEATSENDDKGNIRIDYMRSEKDTFFGRYTIGNSPQTIQGFAPLSSRINNLNGRNVALGWTHVFSPTLLNSFTAGLNRVFNTPYLPPPGSPDLVKTWGYQNVTTFSSCNGLPGVGLTGYSGGGPSSLCIFLLTQNVHFSVGPRVDTGLTRDFS